MAFYAFQEDAASPHLARIHKHLIPIVSNMLPLLVAPERFPHVEGVGVVVVVVYYATVDGVSVWKSALVLPYSVDITQ